MERLTALAPNMDVYIIPDNLPPYRPKPVRRQFQEHFHLSDLLKMVGVLALCTTVGVLFSTFHFVQINIITIYILGVLIISNQTDGRIYGLSSSVLSVLIYNYVFIEPRFTFNAYGTDYPVTFLIMLIASLITSSLTMRVKYFARFGRNNG